MTAELYAAFATAQAQFINPPKTKTAKVGSYSYTYADLPEILDAVRPVLAEHGLAVLQSVASMDGMVGVKTILVHRSGESTESAVLWLPAGDTPQQAGSAVTYARRYSLCGFLGIAADEDDDAGNVAPKKTSRRAAGKPAAAEAPEGYGEGPDGSTAAAGTSSAGEEASSTPNSGGPSTPPASQAGPAGDTVSSPPRHGACLHLAGTKLDRERSRAEARPVHVCAECGEEIPG